MKIFSRFALIIILGSVSLLSIGQKTSLAYTVKMENPEWHFFQVDLLCKGIIKESIDFKMPVWTPGYYQRLDFAKNVKNFKATDAAGNELKWEKTADNTWKVASNKNETVRLFYEIKTEMPFVATPYVDENRAYILPAGVFFHIDKMIKHPVQVTVMPYHKWDRVATGLDSVAGKKYIYKAPDFDVLYDSPILAGNLEELPFFKIRGITHRFIGYKLGNFDREQLILDLKKIVDASVNLIGHIPYKHYTFIAIGPGAGGIEHLNNTTFGFNGNGLDNRESYIRMLHFLAHEYFHHYNVKRIRPIEFGPFDYDKGSRTKMLWLSEGLSVYYEYIVVRRAGVSTDEELLNALRGNMTAFENKPGKKYQTLEQASYETWSDGPFGRSNDEVNKTISYYDKGPAVGLLLDLRIRELTANKRSLDDVMRLLYKDFYQKKQRGFSDEELRAAFETVAGNSLAEEFEYITTTEELDYTKYFSYAGLQVDTSLKELPGTYAGFTTRERNDSVYVATVDYESPAWNAGLRRGQYMTSFNGEKPSVQKINSAVSKAERGKVLKLRISSLNASTKATESAEAELIIGIKKEKQFPITPVANPSPLQKLIYDSWIKG